MEGKPKSTQEFKEGRKKPNHLLPLPTLQISITEVPADQVEGHLFPSAVSFAVFCLCLLGMKNASIF